MVQVSGGTWNSDGTLAQAAAYVSGSNARITGYGYDWRDRRTSVTTNDGLNNAGELLPAQNTLDNLEGGQGREAGSGLHFVL